MELPAFLTSDEALYLATGHGRCLECGHLYVFHFEETEGCRVDGCECDGADWIYYPFCKRSSTEEIDTYNPW